MYSLTPRAATTPALRNLLSRSFLWCGLLLTPIAWLALSAETRAVTPAPDGGYPNGNTAEGTNALFSLTSGGSNTAIGFQALFRNTSGTQNTASGLDALFNNTTGARNTASGFEALLNNTTAADNTATGFSALANNTTGIDNTAVGSFSLANNSTGANNTATGFEALKANTTGNANTAIGFHALFNSTTGGANTAIGTVALASNTTGNNNTASGQNALVSNTGGSNNAAYGFSALFENTTGTNNTSTGFNALVANTTGHDNVADGFQTLFNCTGNNNIAIGSNAGSNLTTGNDNIDIGALGAAGESGKIRIGKQGTQNVTFIAGIFGTTVTGSQVVVGSNGKLGVASSSVRFKEAIKPMDKASEAILVLKPVTFRYKEELDPDKIPQFGLVAEQVEKVNPDLVVRDEEGKPYTVRYEAVNAMLLNEFLKEHRVVQDQQGTIGELRSDVAKEEAAAAKLKQELQAKIARQQKQIEALTAGLQKVTARVEAANPVPRVVSDN